MADSARPPCDEAIILAGPCETLFDNNGTWILATAILGSSMAFIDSTVVNVALPVLQSDLRVTCGCPMGRRILRSFLGVSLLIGHTLGDMYGRRRLFAIGAATFTAASAWCGLSRNIEHLIVARALQGIGGALLVPVVWLLSA